MPMDQSKINKISDTIDLLEQVRDKALAAGQGPNMPGDIFKLIDDLYGKLVDAGSVSGGED